MFLRICELYAKLLNSLLTFLGVVLLCAVALQVAGRYVFFIPPWFWPQEVINFALIWGIFIGATLGVREGRHFCVDIFQFKGGGIGPGFERFLRILYYLVLFSVTFIFIFYGYQYFVKWGMIQSSDITGVNLGWLYVSVPVTGVSWLLFLVESLVRGRRSPSGPGTRS